MIDIGSQLRDYLDATAPPVGVDEILARPVSDLPVRPLEPRRPDRTPRAWAYGAVAAVIVAVLVGGVAWLSRTDGGTEPADEPTATTAAPDPTSTTNPASADPNRPSDPELGAAYDIVLDAFTAIGDADWERFLGHLDPEGVVIDGASAGFFAPATVTELLLPPSAGDSGVLSIDYNGDGVVQRAETFVAEAHYLALAPIEVLECSRSGLRAVCLVKDTSVFIRAGGFEPGPISVVVGDSRIVEIRLGEQQAYGSMGDCPNCGGVWDKLAYEYQLWLGLIPADATCSERSLACGEAANEVGISPLGIIDAGMTGAGGFGVFPWINPDSFDEHRELIPQWLESSSPDAPSDAELEAAHDVVLDAFTAIYDADWQRFLNHLHPDGVFLDSDTGSEYAWSVVAIDEVYRADVDLDVDDNGIITRAEQFLLAAQYLAFVPIEIVSCEPTDDGAVQCLVNDSAVFHRAAGVNPDPIAATVRNGQIEEIAVTMYTQGGQAIIVGSHTLGGCDSGCGVASGSPFSDTINEYSDWLGLSEAERNDPEHPLAITWVSVSDTTGFAELRWFNPASYEEHREFIPEWLASRGATADFASLTDAYVAEMANRSEAAALEFDTSGLGAETRLVSVDPDTLGRPFWDGEGRQLSPEEPDRTWFVSVRLEGSAVTVAFWIERIGDTGGELRLEIAESPDTFWGYGKSGIPHAPHLIVAARSAPTGLIAIGGLPPDAAVIALVPDQGSSSWQRPLQGVAVFEARTGGTDRFVVFDHSGGELLQITIGTCQTQTGECNADDYEITDGS